MINRLIFFPIAAAAILGVVSCASGDPANAAKKKSVSIGRMGGLRSTGAETPVEAAAAAATEEKPVETAVAQAPKPKQKREDFVEPEAPRKDVGNNEGILLQNMLGLPSEKELKATNPSVPKSGDEGGAVISRPPVEKKE